MHIHTQKGGQAAQRPLILEGVAWGGVIISAAIAAVGVSGLVGWATWLTILGSSVLIAGTILTEIAASRLPVKIQEHAAAGGVAGFGKAGMVLAGFAALTAWNVMTGHMGAAAITEAGVAEQRRPFEMAAAQADANRIAAENALAAFDAETTRRAEARLAVIMGADGRYVTARGRETDRAEEAADARETERRPLLEAQARALAADAQAEAALAHAPTGRPDHELWAFAMILELLKGALVWFAAPIRRDHRPATGAVIAIDPKAVAGLTDEEIEALWERLAEHRSLNTVIWHERRKRERRAA